MEAKHTMGTWTANGQRVYADNFLSMEIAFCSNGIIMGKEESFEITQRTAEANARLIAAAPELLEIVESIRPFLDVNSLTLIVGGLKTYRDDIDAAIAKAKGVTCQ